MKLAKVRIETDDSPIVSKWKVFINDMDITHSVRGIELSAFAGEVAYVTVNLLANVEIPSEFKAEVEMDELEPIDDPYMPGLEDRTPIGSEWKVRAQKKE